MEIGISHDQLIDIGLNAAGFLIAGLMLLMIRSLFAGKTQVETAPAAETVTANDEPEPEEEKTTAANPQFFDLKQARRDSSKEDAPVGPSENLKFRNRQEIIQLARKMLTGGGNDAEAGSLPLTDGELSLIKQNLNLQGAGRSE